VRQRDTGNARIQSTHERRNAEVEQRARNAQAAVQAAPRGRGAQRGRGRGAGRGRGRRGGGGEVHEMYGGAFIQFQV
jgi:hypothetical protein